MAIVSELEVIQLRHGDVLLIKPKGPMRDSELCGICDQLKAYLEMRKIRVYVGVLPHNVELVVIREDKR